MLKEIATGRIVSYGETHVSSVSGRTGLILGNETINGTQFVIVRFDGEDFPRRVLAKNFGMYNV